MRTALSSEIIFMSGLAAGRILSLLLDSGPSPMLIVYTVAELGLAAWEFCASSRVKQRSSQPKMTDGSGALRAALGDPGAGGSTACLPSRTSPMGSSSPLERRPCLYRTLSPPTPRSDLALPASWASGASPFPNPDGRSSRARHQGLPGLRASVSMAQEMEGRLGGGALLLGAVPPPPFQCFGSP